MKQTWPAPQRNQAPLLAVLREVLPPKVKVLEVASGTGQHAAYFTEREPGWHWHPTELDPTSLASIEAWRQESGCANFGPPRRFDVTSTGWPEAEAIFCANMIHIAPWQCTVALFHGAAEVLDVGQPLVTYGPYQVDGAHTAPSNATFDESLRQRDPTWGVRDLNEIVALAEQVGLKFDVRVAMPANNFTLVFRRF